MWKEIKSFIKDLYLKLSCNLCCRSNCSMQIGRDEQTRIDEQTRTDQQERINTTRL